MCIELGPVLGSSFLTNFFVWPVWRFSVCDGFGMSKAKAEERPVPKPAVVVADCAEAIQQAAFELATKAWKGVDVRISISSLWVLY